MRCTNVTPAPNAWDLIWGRKKGFLTLENARSSRAADNAN